MGDGDAHLRTAAAAALAQAGSLAQPAVAELIRILEKDADNDARTQAAVALGNTGPGAQAAVPALLRGLLHDPFLGVRVNAAGALGQIHSDAAKVVPALVEACLKDAEPEVRIWCIRSMRVFKEAPPIARRALETFAGDPANQQLPEFPTRVLQLRNLLGPTDPAQ